MLLGEPLGLFFGREHGACLCTCAPFKQADPFFDHGAAPNAIYGPGQQHDVPIIHFSRGQKKDAFDEQQRTHFSADEGVVFIGVGQEKARDDAGPAYPLPRGQYGRWG